MGYGSGRGADWAAEIDAQALSISFQSMAARCAPACAEKLIVAVTGPAPREGVVQAIQLHCNGLLEQPVHQELFVNPRRRCSILSAPSSEHM